MSTTIHTPGEKNEVRTVAGYNLPGIFIFIIRPSFYLCTVTSTVDHLCTSDRHCVEQKIFAEHFLNKYCYVESSSHSQRHVQDDISGLKSAHVFLVTRDFVISILHEIERTRSEVERTIYISLASELLPSRHC